MPARAPETLVVDSSALINLLLYPKPSTELRRRMDSVESLHAPHLLDLEFLQVPRALVRSGKVPAERAGDARSDLGQLPLIRYPHTGLTDRVWGLRHNLTSYDAAYVALSEVLQAPLVTSDARLAAATGHTAAVELYPLG